MRALILSSALLVMAAAPSCAAPAAKPGQKPAEEEWKSTEVGNGWIRAGWSMSAPTKELLHRLSCVDKDSVIAAPHLREAFPKVRPPAGCKITWDLRMFPKDTYFYGTLEGTAAGFMSPDPKKQKVSMLKHADRPAMWVENYSTPGGRRGNGYTMHSYLCVDIGRDMLIFSQLAVSPEPGGVKACAAAYTEQFKKVALTMKPLNAAPAPAAGPSAVPLLR